MNVCNVSHIASIHTVLIFTSLIHFGWWWRCISAQDLSRSIVERLFERIGTSGRIFISISMTYSRRRLAYRYDVISQNGCHLSSQFNFPHFPELEWWLWHLTDLITNDRRKALLSAYDDTSYHTLQERRKYQPSLASQLYYTAEMLHSIMHTNLSEVNHLNGLCIWKSYLGDEYVFCINRKEGCLHLEKCMTGIDLISDLTTW